MEEGLLPHQSSIDEDNVDEERRLAYVGITRAQKELTFTLCKERRQYGELVRPEPSRFLLEIRLNQIRHLLDSTDLTLAEIARRCGYGSDMALSLAFRRETGIPPGEYRNSRRHMEP